MKINYIAHISEDGRVQTVKEHLEGTALLAADFARTFDGAELGFLTGLSHDIGKYSGKFQERIRNPKLHQGLDHSTAGAQLLWKEKLYPAAFAVAGHHGGLPDGGTKADKGQGSTMLGRISKNVEDCGAWREELKLPAARLPERVPPRRVFTGLFYQNALLLFGGRRLSGYGRFYVGWESEARHRAAVGCFVESAEQLY